MTERSFSPERVEDVIADCAFADAVRVSKRHNQPEERCHQPDRPVHLRFFKSSF